METRTKVALDTRINVERAVRKVADRHNGKLDVDIHRLDNHLVAYGFVYPTGDIETVLRQMGMYNLRNEPRIWRLGPDEREAKRHSVAQTSFQTGVLEAKAAR